MSAEAIAAGFGIAVYLALRLIDYLLPKGRHWTFVERFSRPDEDEEG